MEKKRDLRVQKTYVSLFQAFQSLLNEKNFENISVTELCNKAMIRTATFYKHFSDKYEFFSFMIQELRNDYFAKRYHEFVFESAESYILNLIRAGFEFLQEHQALVQIVASDNMMNIITKTTGDSLRKDLIKQLDKFQNSGYKLIVSPALTAEILIGSINQLSRWWLLHKNDTSIDELIYMITPFINSLIIEDS